MPNATKDTSPAVVEADDEIVEAEVLDDGWELEVEPQAERTALEKLADDQRQQLIDNEKVTGAFLRKLADSNPDLFKKAKDTEADALRKNTQTSYRYWMSRLRRWCEKPESRFRGREDGPIPFDSLFPVSINTEAVFRVWLEDVTNGPTDVEEWQEWKEDTGKFAPSTLTIIQAALKNEISNRQVWPWEPTTSFRNWWRGLRNQCGLGYRTRQATPLCGDEVYKIARHLYLNETPLLARDRVVLEATVAGLTPAEIGRLRLGSVLDDASGTVKRTGKTPDGATVEWEETALFSGKRLVVPGQVRSHGKRSEATVLDLTEHPQLATAIDRWLAVRDVDGESLLFGKARNLSDRARKSLIRTAEIAEVTWRPTHGKKLPKAKAAVMRSALMNGTKWGAELTRMRSHVMLLVGFTAALRRSELCNLTIDDVTFHDATTAEIWIAVQKTSDSGATVTINNPRNGDPAVQRVLDAVPLLREWIATLTELGATKQTPLFPALDRHGNFAGGKVVAVTGQAWSDRLRGLARAATVFDDPADERYNKVMGHSLRRGFVTDAIYKDIDPIKIGQITRHKNIDMIARYAEQLKQKQNKVTEKLFLEIAA